MKYCSSILSAAILVNAIAAQAATTQKRYYAHEAVEDSNGVIAPWYHGQNGQCDFRVRVAAETLKRYPWTDKPKAVAALPEFIFSGAWKIAADGTITIPPIRDWQNGDLGQRAAYVLSALVDYYRYSGDPAAIALITCQANALLDYALTPDDHPWPKFLISVPVQGKPYVQADPHGFIQLDIVAEVGIGMIRAYQLTGYSRWFEAAKHWGDLLAEKRYCTPGMNPWPRYANPQDVPWDDHSTGGVAFILEFFDTLIRAGYTGTDNRIIQAREAGIAYLRDVLLPNWTGRDTWGRNYWDWNNNVQAENVTEFAARYLMDHPDEFPLWRTDARNILALFLNRTSVFSGSGGDVYSGAWAYPESSGCCKRSLWYGPLELAFVYAMYAERTGSEWARELARRQIILATYDGHETGVVEDDIDGGQVVAGNWFKIAHPMALKHVLAAMALMPDLFGAARENHIVRSSSVVANVEYGRGRVAYTTFDAPANTMDVLRLAFEPTEIIADGKPLSLRKDGAGNGYQCRALDCGDFIVTIRHDGAKNVVVHGNDPQQQSEDIRLAASGDAATTFAFEGNQVRLIGSVGPDSGLSDVYLDDVKQLCGIDCWNPDKRRRQVLWYRNGLPGGKHVIRVVANGTKNPLSKGTRVRVEAVQWSAAAGDNGFGEGGGPTEHQRLICGYTGRTDYMDSQGNTWRPATECVTRSAGPRHVDSVDFAWWTSRTRLGVVGTPDPELYRYGLHGEDFWVNLTVGPGEYYARLKFMETRNIPPQKRAVTIRINDEIMVADVDIAATAAAGNIETREVAHPREVKKIPAGMVQPVDLVFNNLKPKNGVICIRFTNRFKGEAMVQAIEVGPGDGGQGAKPVSVPANAETSSASSPP